MYVLGDEVPSFKSKQKSHLTPIVGNKYSISLFKNHGHPIKLGTGISGARISPAALPSPWGMRACEKKYPPFSHFSIINNEYILNLCASSATSRQGSQRAVHTLMK